MLTQEQAAAIRAAIAAGATRKAAAKVLGVAEKDVRDMVPASRRNAGHARVVEARPLIVQAAQRNDDPKAVATALGVSYSVILDVWRTAPELAEWRARPPVQRPGESEKAFVARRGNWKVARDPVRAAARAAKHSKTMTATMKRKARVAEARARKAINGHAAPQPSVPVAVDKPRRPWWRRLLGWS